MKAPSPRAEGALLRLRVRPGASSNAILGWQGDTLRVRVTAPPLEGRANRAVIELLARALGVRPSAVSLLSGERGRDKLLHVAGLAPADIRGRLA
ncbi:MAG: DUF167 domain-containing protein [Candidatus Rokubacteria bacterium]|nr:DUF167 domain-containing protein [Candidatus Rokubacteria bacterium]